MNKIKAVKMVRVSTKRQEDEGISIDHQNKGIDSYALENGFDIVKEYIFHESAGNKIRRNFDEMIACLKQNPDVKAVIACRVDRMTRNFRDAVLMDELRNVSGLELHFIEDHLVLDQHANSQAMQSWELKVFLAKQYLNQLHDHGVNTWKDKIEDGEWATTAPIGYRNFEISAKERSIEIDPERGDLVRKAFELYATGRFSMRLLAKELQGLGLTTRRGGVIDSSQIDVILANPFYYGMMLFKGQLHPHKYEPLISKWLFEKCQQVKRDWHKKPFQYGAKNFVFKGVVDCGACGHSISTYTKKGLNYVRCHYCKAIHEREEVFLEQVKDIFVGMRPTRERIESIKVDLRKIFDDESNFYKSNSVRIQTELTKIDNRLARMFEMRLDGEMTHEDYDDYAKTYKRKRDELNRELQDHQSGDESFLLTSSYLLELAHRAGELFETSQTAQKNQLLRLILANCKIEGKNLVFNLKKPFEAMRLANETGKWLPLLDKFRTVNWTDIKNRLQFSGIFELFHIQELSQKS